MEDMRDSNTAPQIVKIVRMVVKFHPLLTITSLIHRIILLQDWIEEEVSNQWEALKVYCQSIMRALLDPITEKMKYLSEAIQMHLHVEAAKGQPKAKLVGKLARISAIFLLLDTELSSKYVTKMLLLLLIGFDPVKQSTLWSQFRIFHGSNSLKSVGAMLCISVFLLCVLLVRQVLVGFRTRSVIDLYKYPHSYKH
ncbi:hypothetical protein SLEP1_g58423 [Rubroshorea leprosula]|uniref:Uncharacterized protein n=1 Tax=Rubroshorea leprosula TaxID=152421 RepID=A0AAV5MQA9_9ROSI|nr:hypothetical protein SLEP1_g58423 [Rubroshorea leprosula]